ncbi:MAG: co-chaperone GroES [Bacteroidales bacterium]|nr:co-chaperone GroES [Bacteroidales bacterium]
MAEVNIKPLGNRVLIEPSVSEEKTASGIIIPDTAKEKQQSGIVLAVGSGSKDNPMEVKVGDKVIYGKFSGTEIEHNGKEYLILEQADILAIV